MSTNVASERIAAPAAETASARVLRRLEGGRHPAVQDDRCDQRALGLPAPVNRLLAHTCAARDAFDRELLVALLADQRQRGIQDRPMGDRGSRATGLRHLTMLNRFEPLYKTQRFVL